MSTQELDRQSPRHAGNSSKHSQEQRNRVNNGQGKVKQDSEAGMKAGRRRAAGGNAGVRGRGKGRQFDTQREIFCRKREGPKSGKTSGMRDQARKGAKQTREGSLGRCREETGEVRSSYGGHKRNTEKWSGK